MPSLLGVSILLVALLTCAMVLLPFFLRGKSAEKLAAFFAKFLPTKMFRRVPVEEVSGEDSEHGDTKGLKRSLSKWDLLIMGIGFIIGTGIFVLPAVAANQHAGPAVILAFALCGVLCALVAPCYAEVASMIRSSGSAFMYAYATLGEIFAWIIGWDLLLEYLFGGSGVAVGFSAYAKNILKAIGVTLPDRFAHAPAQMPWMILGVGLGVAGLLFLLRLLVIDRVTALRTAEEKHTFTWTRLFGRLFARFMLLVLTVVPVAKGRRMNQFGLGGILVLLAVGLCFGVLSGKLVSIGLLAGTACALLGTAVLVVGLCALFGVDRYSTHFREELEQPALRCTLMGTIWSTVQAVLNLLPVVALCWTIVMLPSFDLPAMVITLLVSGLLVLGVHHTQRATNLFVLIKLAVIVIFLGLACWYISPSNFVPFIPERSMVAAEHGELHPAYGPFGILTAAAIVLFAFIGFDGVTTASAEAKEPQKSVPFGVLGSLAICTVLYMAVAVVMVGCVNYKELGGSEAAAPIVKVLEAIGYHRLSWLVSLGAMAGIMSALTLSLYSQSRVQMSMANRGLISSKLGEVSPRFGTPVNAIVIWGVVAALVAGLFPIDELSELTNIGTLAAFILVCLGIPILRWTEPDRPRPFRCPSLLSPVVTILVRVFTFNRVKWTCPWLPDVPLLGALGCLCFMLALPLLTWIRFGIWMAIGLVIYFVYGYRNSKLASKKPTE